jgi:PAS domain S-box-containing protein
MNKKKPTYKELEQRIRELEEKAGQGRGVKESLTENAGENLKKIEREKETILNIMTENLAFFGGRDLKIKWANRAYCESVGLSEKEVVGHCCHKIWHQRDEPCEDCHILKVFETGKPRERATSVLEGRKFYIRAYPVLDKNGKVEGVFESGQNITLRKNAEEELRKANEELERRVEERTADLAATNKKLRKQIKERKLVERTLRESERTYREIFNAVNDAIFIQELETGDLIDANKKMCEMLGYSREELPSTLEPLISNIQPNTMEEARKLIRKAAKGEPQFFEWQAKHKNGRLFWVEVDLKKALIAGKQRILAITRDITERKQAEEVLKKSEERYSLAVKGSSDGIWDWQDISDDKYWWSPRVYELFGYKDGEIEARISTWKELMHPEDRDKALAAVQGHFEKRVPYDTEFRMKTKSGEYRWFRGRGQALWDDKGNPTRMSGSIQDITERKQAEQDLRISERLLNETQRLSKIGAWEYDLESGKGLWTDEVYRIHELPVDEEVDLNKSLQCYFPEDRPVIEQAFKEALEKGKPYDIVSRFITARGKKRWVRTNAKAIRKGGKIVRAYGNIMDITERKQAEEALRESEERYRSLINNIELSVNLMDLDYNIVMVNDATGKLMQKDADLCIGKKCYREFEKRNTVCPHCPGKRTMATGRSQEVETKGVRDDGTTFDVHMRTFPKYGPNDTIEGFIEIVEDITERKRAQQALKKSEENYRRIVETAYEGIWIIDADENTVFVNRRMAEMLGYTVGKMLGRKLFDFMLDQSKTRAEYYLERRRMGIKEQRESLLLCKDGKELWVNISAAPIQDDAGHYIGALEMVTDITERKRAEEQIRASLMEKEVLLQEIYHRVKNNLQVISSLLNLKARTLESSKEAGVFGDCQNFVKAMTLVHEKLYHSEDLVQINYKEYVLELVGDLMRAYLPEKSAKITVKYDLEEVFLDRNSAVTCGLVLNELIANSLKHAFPKRRKGEIKISMHAGDNGEVKLVVADNGVGIPPGLDFHETDSVGLLLVTGLVENQLQGEIEFTGTAGTEIRIIFTEETS